MVCITQGPTVPQGSSCLPQPVNLPVVSCDTSLLAGKKAAPNLEVTSLVAVVVLSGRLHWIFLFVLSQTHAHLVPTPLGFRELEARIPSVTLHLWVTETQCGRSLGRI